MYIGFFVLQGNFYMLVLGLLVTFTEIRLFILMVTKKDTCIDHGQFFNAKTATTTGINLIFLFWRRM